MKRLECQFSKLGFVEGNASVERGMTATVGRGVNYGHKAVKMSLGNPLAAQWLELCALIVHGLLRFQN